MKKTFLKGKISVKADGEKVTIVASDETLDRHGEVVPIETWDLTNFMMAPRLLVDHDYSIESIVGKANNIRIEGKQLLFEPEFHEITELAQTTKQLVLAGYLDTVSVGFIPHGPEKDGDTGRNELIEISFVTVPANPKARIVRDLKSNIEVDEFQRVALKEFAGITEEDVVDEVKVIKTVEQFKEFAGEFPDEAIMQCEAYFINNLVADSEKLLTLTEANQKLKEVVASKDRQHKKMLRLALKEVAKTVSDALRKSKVHE